MSYISDGIYTAYQQSSELSRPRVKQNISQMLKNLIDACQTMVKTNQIMNSSEFRDLDAPSQLHSMIEAWHDEFTNLNLAYRRNLSKLMSDLKYLVGTLPDSDKLFDSLDRSQKYLKENWDSDPMSNILILRSKEKLDDIVRIADPSANFSSNIRETSSSRVTSNSRVLNTKTNLDTNEKKVISYEDYMKEKSHLKEKSNLKENINQSDSFKLTSTRNFGTTLSNVKPNVVARKLEPSSIRKFGMSSMTETKIISRPISNPVPPPISRSPKRHIPMVEPASITERDVVLHHELPPISANAGIHQIPGPIHRTNIIAPVQNLSVQTRPIPSPMRFQSPISTPLRNPTMRPSNYMSGTPVIERRFVYRDPHTGEEMMRVESPNGTVKRIDRSENVSPVSSTRHTMASRVMASPRPVMTNAISSPYSPRPVISNRTTTYSPRPTVSTRGISPARPTAYGTRPTLNTVSANDPVLMEARRDFGNPITDVIDVDNCNRRYN